MTKQEYLQKLTEKLSIFEEDLAKEIISDYEEHFREGLENGRSEEEISRELGDIDEIIEELRQIYEPQKKNDAHFQETVNEVVNDAINLASNVADTIVKGIKTGIDYGKRNWYERAKEDIVDAECTGEKIYNCHKTVIDAGCAHVIVEATDQEEFQVEYVNLGSLKDKILYHFKGEQKGDVFYGRMIREQGNSSLFQMLKVPEIRIRVKVPADFESVDIVTTSGSITIDKIQVKELKLTAASGDLVVNESSGERVTMETASGDLTVSNTKGSVLKIKSKSGDINLGGVDFVDVSCKGRSGDFSGTENQMPGCTIELTSGDIELENSKSDAAAISTKSGGIYMSETKTKELIMSTDSGDICMKGAESEKLDVSSESGDIKIESNTADYKLHNVSGDIILVSENEMNAEIQSVSGEISIEITNGKEGYSADIQSVSGSVELHFEGTSKYGMHKGIYTMGDGKSAIAVSNVSGDILIRA